MRLTLVSTQTPTLDLSTNYIANPPPQHAGTPNCYSETANGQSYNIVPFLTVSIYKVRDTRYVVVGHVIVRAASALADASPLPSSRRRRAVAGEG